MNEVKRKISPHVHLTKTGTVVISVVLAVLLIVVIATESVYRTTWDKSLQRIKQQQEYQLDANNDPTIRTKFVLTISRIGGGNLILVLTCVLFAVTPRQRARSFYFIQVMAVAIFLTSVGKTAYFEPTPWIADNEVWHSLGCSADLAHPSFNGLIEAAFAFSLFFDLSTVLQENKIGKLLCMRFGLSCLQIVLFFAAVSWTAISGISLLRTGQQSINQVAYGWLLGVWSALFMHFLWRDRFFILANSFQQIKPVTEPAKVLMIFSAVYGVGFVAELVSYFATMFKTIPDLWVENLYSDCAALWLKTHGTLDGFFFNFENEFNSKSLQLFGRIFFGYGAAVGLLIQRKLLKDKSYTFQDEKYILKGFLRVVIFVILAIPFILLQVFPLTNKWGNLFATEIAGTTSLFLLNFGFLDWLCLKTHLLSELPPCNLEQLDEE